MKREYKKPIVNRVELESTVSVLTVSYHIGGGGESSFEQMLAR